MTTGTVDLIEAIRSALTATFGRRSTILGALAREVEQRAD
jgi:hypothetical protein